MDHKGPTTDANKRRRDSEISDDSVANKLLKKSIKDFEKTFNTNNLDKLFQLKKERFNPKPNLISRSRKSSINSSTSSLNNNMDTAEAEVNSGYKTDNDGFTSPNKTGRIQKTNSQQNLNLSNRFQPLYTQSQDESNASSSGTRPRTPSVEPNRATNNTRSRGKRTPPPIHVMGSSLKIIISTLINNKINKNKFSTKEVGNNVCTIFAFDIDQYKEIVKILIDLKWEFYTYTPREEKPKTLVLKGVRGGYDEIDVKTEIESLNLNEIKITKVSKLTFNRNNMPLHHFIVQLTNDSTKTQLTSIKFLLNQKISWENLRRKNIFQCRNCQRAGHASSNCHLARRCVKCAGNHPHGECTLVKEEPRNNLTCANCGEKGHPASYMGCPYLKLAQDMKNNNNAKRQENKRSNIIKQASLVRPNVSYASLLHPNVEVSPRVTRDFRQPMDKVHESQQIPPNTNRFNDENIKYNSNCAEQEQNSINKLINRLKEDLTSLITTQFMDLEKKISNNTNKIEFILSQMFQNV